MPCKSGRGTDASIDNPKLPANPQVQLKRGPVGPTGWIEGCGCRWIGQRVISVCVIVVDKTDSRGDLLHLSRPPGGPSLMSAFIASHSARSGATIPQH